MRKDRFLIFSIKKKAFSTRKRKFEKVQKNRFFSQGVSPWFLSKNRSFYHLCFWANQARQDHFLIFWIKKHAIKTRKRKF